MKTNNSDDRFRVAKKTTFGMPALIELDTIEECAALCRELSLDFVEISMSLPQYTLEAIDVDSFKNTAEKYGIGYTIHLDENVNFSDFNTYAADASRRYIADTLTKSKQLGIKTVNMHLHRGEHFTLPNKKIDLFEVYRDRYIKSICEFRTMCESMIGETDIRICIENCKGYPEHQRQALDILLTSPVFGLTFDIGHNRCGGNIDEEYILKNSRYLYHMHLHDAVEKTDHLALGDGDIDIDKYLQIAYDRKCSVVLETKTVEGLKRSVGYLRRKGIL